MGNFVAHEEDTATEAEIILLTEGLIVSNSDNVRSRSVMFMASYDKYKDTAYLMGNDPSSTIFQQFITDYEGLEINDDDTHEQNNHQDNQ
jgi:hypothetical protein